jgi:hypothetical protein
MNRTLAITAAIDNLRSITFTPPVRGAAFCSFVTERSVNRRNGADGSICTDPTNFIAGGKKLRHQ